MGGWVGVLPLYSSSHLPKPQQRSLLLMRKSINSLPASGEFCHLLITFANSLDPDQGRQKDPKCFRHSDGISKKLILKKSADDKKVCKISSSRHRVNFKRAQILIHLNVLPLISLLR